MEKNSEYAARQEGIIKKQEDRISQLEKNAKRDIVKKHDVSSDDDDGIIRF